METGLLWFDNDPTRELTAKIEDAARRYKEKFGAVPNTCYVNQTAVDGSEIRVPLKAAQNGVLRVVPASNILLHHFWVGIEEQREAA